MPPIFISLKEACLLTTTFHCLDSWRKTVFTPGWRCPKIRHHLTSAWGDLLLWKAHKHHVTILWTWLFCVMSNDSGCIASCLLILCMFSHEQTVFNFLSLFSCQHCLSCLFIYRFNFAEVIYYKHVLSPFMSQIVYNLLLRYTREWDITFSTKNFLNNIKTSTLGQHAIGKCWIRSVLELQGKWLHFKILGCYLCIRMHMCELPFINEVVF